MTKTVCFYCFLAIALFTAHVTHAKVNRRAKIAKYKGDCTELDNKDSKKREAAVSKCTDDRALYISAKYDPVTAVRLRAAKKLRSEALRAKLRSLIEEEKGLSKEIKARFLKILKAKKKKAKARKRTKMKKRGKYQKYPPIQIQTPPKRGLKKKLEEKDITVVVFTNGRLRSVRYLKRKLQEIDPDRINRLIQDVGLNPSEINVYEINYRKDKRSEKLFRYLTKKAKKRSARVRPRVFVRQGSQWWSYKLPRTRSALKVVIRFARQQAKKRKIKVDDIDIH